MLGLTTGPDSGKSVPAFTLIETWLNEVSFSSDLSHAVNPAINQILLLCYEGFWN